jgi:replicative DNA helicase
MPDVEPTPEELRVASANGHDARTLSQHRVLPQSQEAERGIVCSIMLNSKDVCSMCASRGVRHDTHFSNPAYGLIFKRAMEMWDRLEVIDFVTLGDCLAANGEIDRVGGHGELAGHFNYLPTAANAEHYIEILEEKAALRKILSVTTDYQKRVYEDGSEPWALVDDFEQEAMSVRHRKAKIDIVHPRDLVTGVVGRIQSMYDRRGEITGIPTGFRKLDQMMDGLHDTDLTVIAGRPSSGKTSIAMNLAEFLVLNLGKSVGVFSLEMSKEQLMQRLMCSRARVNLARIRDGQLSERDFPAIGHAATEFSNSKLWIDDTSSLSIEELRGRARWMKMQYNIDALFVDYLQLARSTAKKAQNNREQEVAEVSRGLKAVAKELHIPVVVLAQLNRFDKGHAKGSYPRPRMSDLRESGSIEADADNILMITRDEMYADPSDEEEMERVRGKATVIIAKQRNGPVGDVPLTFLDQYARFETRAMEGDEEAAANQGALI